eukprot:1157722-Pelagomonas_calceolata.AAC.7
MSQTIHFRLSLRLEFGVEVLLPCMSVPQEAVHCLTLFEWQSACLFHRKLCTALLCLNGNLHVCATGSCALPYILKLCTVLLGLSGNLCICATGSCEPPYFWLEWQSVWGRTCLVVDYNGGCQMDLHAKPLSVEKALRQQNGIARVAKDMSTALEQLAASDYTGSTLLQLKKQVCHKGKEAEHTLKRRLDPAAASESKCVAVM